MIKKTFSFAKNYIKDILALPFYCRSPEIETNKILEGAVSYVDSLRVEDYEYLFSNAAQSPTLFSSVYATLTYGLSHSQIENTNGWFEFFDSFQDDDGMWRDKQNPFRNWESRSDEWNEIHLASHIIYAYEAIGKIPSKDFRFLDKFKNMKYTSEFCNNIDFEKFWGESNGVMNYLVSMMYSRDVMGNQDFEQPIEYMIEFLKKRMDATEGLWTLRRDKDSLYEAIRGGYHVWMLMIQEGVEFDGVVITNIIDTILDLQNKYGGFNKQVIADTCHNIDCIDPLVRFAFMKPGYRSEDIKRALIRSRRYLLNNRNGDGGFCFRRLDKMHYGCDAHISLRNGSNIFATWFSLLALLIIEDYFGEGVWLQSFLPGLEYSVRLV